MPINFIKKSNKAYTLVEVLISIAIFGVISVVMTGIVINMGALSLTTDRRTDFLNELEYASTFIKNEMRTADKLGLCSTATSSASPTALYITQKDSAGNPIYTKLSVMTDSGTTKLVLSSLTSVNNGDCINLQPNPTTQMLTSNKMKIQNLNLIKSVSTTSAQPDTLLYISFEACDADSVARKVISCGDANGLNANPYRYVFAITSRNL